MAESRLVKGTLILSIAVFLTKMLGLVFVIPFNALVGPKGTALYSYGYTPYSILLSIATMGVPLAVSKFVAKYNALGDYHTGRRLFRSGLVLMTCTGIISFLILFLLAPVVAPFSVQKSTDGNTAADVTLVIRVVSIALIIIPSMSLIRGYFQGFQSMGPTATSQLIEQLVRVGFILVGSYVVRVLMDGSVTYAVAVATFAAFLGGLASLFILIRYWIKRKPHLDKMVAESTVDYHVPLIPMYKELITYAIPFVAVGIAIPLFQLVDQFTFSFFLVHYRNVPFEQADEIFGILNMNAQKIIMIPVSLSTALALTVVPTITKSFSERDYATLHRDISQSLQMVLFITIPAAIGLSVLGYMIYGLLYGVGDREILTAGGEILRWYAPSSIFFAVFSVSAAILQGINRQKVTVFSLSVGLLLKMVCNPIMIKYFGTIGPILATNLGYLVAIGINLYMIKGYTSYHYRFLTKRFLLISIFTGVMTLAVNAMFWLTGVKIPSHYWQAGVYSLIGVIIGVIVFAFLSLRSGLARQILGTRVSLLKKRGTANSH